MTLGSVFTGIGLLDLGLERAGFQTRWQIEIEPYCCQVLERHWPGLPRLHDVREVTGEELERVDAICGGYPCQPFSLSGAREGENDPRHLWPHLARIVRVVRPRYVILENVPGHLSLGFGTVLGDLAGLGYDAEWTCLRASEFGAAHLRKRVFVVAYRQEGRRGIGGESSWCGGLTDGSDAELGDATGARYAHGESTSSNEGEPDEWRVSESSRRCDPVGDATQQFNHGSGDPGAIGRGEHPNTSFTVGDGQFSEPRRSAKARDGLGPASAVLPNAGGAGLPDSEREAFQRPRRRLEGRAASELCGSFAPGPSDPQWGDLLRERPDLAPALSIDETNRITTQAAVEPALCGVADGSAHRMDRSGLILGGVMQHRAKRLRALGNAVVPQVAEWVGRRILEVYGEEL